jgi:hypothetical protein
MHPYARAPSTCATHAPPSCREAAGALPALLPEPSSGGPRLQPGGRGLRRQDALKDLLSRALAIAQNASAPEAFIASVRAALVHVRIKHAAPEWDDGEVRTPWDPRKKGGA